MYHYTISYTYVDISSCAGCENHASCTEGNCTCECSCETCAIGTATAYLSTISEKTEQELKDDLKNRHEQIRYLTFTFS